MKENALVQKAERCGGQTALGTKEILTETIEKLDKDNIISNIRCALKRAAIWEAVFESDILQSAKSAQGYSYTSN